MTHCELRVELSLDQMRGPLDQQSKAVMSGRRPLILHDSLARAANGNAFLPDSPGPRIRLGDYRKGEQRRQTCEDTPTGTAGDFPAHARKDR